jgi:pyruvate/2-oxoacid:ferredoxin oxidoreductase beta subunit
MLKIALAHGVNYVAQSTIAFPDDISNKVKKALATPGPSYIQILCPCIPGWKIKTDQAGQGSRLAVQTALYPLLEYTNGKLSASSINKNFKALAVDKYLSIQGRFKHLSKTEIKQIQALADKNIKLFKL